MLAPITETCWFWQAATHRRQSTHFALLRSRYWVEKSLLPAGRAPSKRLSSSMPMSLQSFCSSQLPLRSQVRHLRSCTLSSSSRVIFLDSWTLGELVKTSMPSFTGYTQAAQRERAPFTSTMHIRQAPIWFISFK